MTAKTKLHYAVLIVLMALTSIQAVAKEKKEKQNTPAKKQELKFITQAMDQRSFNRIADQTSSSNLTHIAMFYASNLPQFNKPHSSGRTRTTRVASASGDWTKKIITKNINIGDSDWPNALLASKAAKNLTADYKILIAKGLGIRISNANPTEFKIYASNALDAKYTAEAIIEVLNDYAETARNELKENANNWQKELADLEKTKEELEKEREQATESLSNTKKQTHYLSTDEANGRIKELNIYLDMERIEIAGIAAGIDAMGEYLAKAGSEKKDALEAKMIDLRIELATVRAKYETAEATRARAEGFISLTIRLANLKNEIKKFLRMIGSRKNTLGIAKTMLLIPAADLFTPKLEPAIVTIYALTEPEQL